MTGRATRGGSGRRSRCTASEPSEQLRRRRFRLGALDGTRKRHDAINLRRAPRAGAQAVDRPWRRRSRVRPHPHRCVRAINDARAVKAWKAAKLEPLTPQEGRHCCASYLAAAGVSPKDAQTILAHADVRTTMGVYTPAVPGWETEAAAKLGTYRELSRQVSHAPS
jgi:integrase